MTTLTLWYATTQSVVRRLFNEGIEPAKPLTAVAEVCAAFDVDVEPVERLLMRWRTRATSSNPGCTGALLTVDRADAECLAQQEPRRRWEALWAVWCVHNGIAPDRPPLWEPEASAWHVDQLFPDAPAIVEVRADVDEVDVERVEASALGWASLSTTADAVAVARLSVPVAAGRVVARYGVSRRISVPAAAGMTGRSTAQLETLAAREQLVSPRDPGSPLGEPYWTIGDIFDLLGDA